MGIIVSSLSYAWECYNLPEPDDSQPIDHTTSNEPRPSLTETPIYHRRCYIDHHSQDTVWENRLAICEGRVKPQPHELPEEYPTRDNYPYLYISDCIHIISKEPPHAFSELKRLASEFVRTGNLSHLTVCERSNHCRVLSFHDEIYFEICNPRQ